MLYYFLLIFLVNFPNINSQELTIFVSSPTSAPEDLLNSTYFSSIEYNLLIMGLDQIGVTYSTKILNLTRIEDFSPYLQKESNAVALGSFRILSENFGKGVLFSIPTGTHYLFALSYSDGAISFSSFLTYFVTNSVFLVFMFLVFFGGLFIFYAEKKANMAFKKEILVGLTLGMWQIYQYFYKKINYSVKSITGRIFTLVIILFFSWLVAYLLGYLIINEFKLTMQKKQANTLFFEFPRIYTNIKLRDVFLGFDSIITTYDNDKTSFQDIINFMQQNSNQVLIIDSISARELFKLTCSFQLESSNFHYFNTGAIMNINSSSETIKTINEAIYLGKNNSDFISNYTQSIYFNNDCSFNYIAFFTTSVESSTINYLNMLDIIILVVSGITLALIAIIFSRKALFYFHKKKKVKRLLKELSSNENRLLKETELFFSKQKEKTLHILEGFEVDLQKFQGKEQKCLEYLEQIHDWSEEYYGNHVLNRRVEKSVSN